MLSVDRDKFIQIMSYINQKITCFCIAILCSQIVAFAQKCQPRMLTKSSELKLLPFSKNDSSTIKSIRFKSWSDKLEFTLKDGSQQKVSGKNFWGYIDEGCNIYRRVNGTFYGIIDTDGIIMYVGHYIDINSTSMFSGNTGMNTLWQGNYFFGQFHGKDIYPMFSKTLDSPPMKLSWSNLEYEFKKDTCFRQKLKKDVGTFANAWTITENNEILANKLYRDCHGSIIDKNKQN